MNMLTINIQSLNIQKKHHNKMKERKNEQKNATHSEIKCATESNKKKCSQNRRMQMSAKMSHQTDTTERVA